MDSENQDNKPDPLVSNTYETLDGGGNSELSHTENKMDTQRKKQRLDQQGLQRPHSSASIMEDNSDSCSSIVFRQPNTEAPRIVSASFSPSSQTRLGKNYSSGSLQTMNQPPNKQSRKGNQNMVLKLVIPNSPAYPGVNDTLSYLRSVSSDSPNDVEFRNRYDRPTSLYGQYYPNNTGETTSNRLYPTLPKDNSTQVVPSPPKHHDYTHASPTPPDEKKKAFSNIFTNSFSIIYAFFTVTIGVTFYTNDVVDQTDIAAEIFSVILVAGSFLFILYITIDITIFMRQKARNEKLLATSYSKEIEVQQTNGQLQFNIELPPMKKMCHNYCFNKDRHSSNFFLKIGATAFCIGHLIHSGLILGYRIVFLTSEEKDQDCSNVKTMVVDVIHPLYSFLLLFFIFKYSNIIINKNVALAKFGVMHCLSSSLCFWVWTIVREIREAISGKTGDKSSSNVKNNDVDTRDHPLNLRFPIDDTIDSMPMTNITLRTFTKICENSDDSLSKMYKDFSPYLYPFSVEYSILVVGVLYIVWQNIAICRDGDNEDEHSTKQCKAPDGYDDTSQTNVAVHVDCQSSNMGLFGGFVILVLVMVSSIVFFITIYGESEGESYKVGIAVNTITCIVIIIIMLIACIIGFYQTTKLDINTSHHGLLDDFLLIICMPAYFLSAIFSIIPAVKYNDVGKIVAITLEFIQVIVQTLFIIDGMRRASNSKELRKRKYGREMITLLVVANVALWLMQTLEIKAHELADNRYKFYGKVPWSIMGHMCLPLLMFYRFHSAVCFGDMWKYCYEPSGH